MGAEAAPDKSERINDPKLAEAIASTPEVRANRSSAAFLRHTDHAIPEKANKIIKIEADADFEEKLAEMRYKAKEEALGMSTEDLKVAREEAEKTFKEAYRYFHEGDFADDVDAEKAAWALPKAEIRLEALNEESESR